jgi:hypothetical protein
MATAKSFSKTILCCIRTLNVFQSFSAHEPNTGSGRPSISRPRTRIASNPGAGTSPSGLSITGGDLAGVIQITIGMGPTTGDVLKVTFGQAKSASTYVAVLTAGSNNAASDFTKVKIQSKATTSFVINAVNVLNAGSIYIWYYIAI